MSIEKTIKLENISLIDFLGVENKNINQVASAFPKSKIISRGDEIKIQGTPPEILRINDILNSLILHYNKYGKITEENVEDFLSKEKSRAVLENKEDILVHGSGGVKITPRTVNQKKIVASVGKHDLAFVLGPAGTGKTYISVALAVRALKNKVVKRIIISRPAVESGESLGFLPGDIKEKVDPYLRPIYDALSDMITQEKLKFYQENGIIEIVPLAYMRGRTLRDAFVLLDEAQNSTAMQMKMFLTRLGPNSKMIITGDPSQIDLPKTHLSGLKDAVQKLEKVDGIGFVYLDEKDIVRHKIVKSIINAYRDDT